MDSYSLRGDLLAEQNEQELVAALRTGDETAFVALVDRYHPSLVRLARMYVRQPSVAEEVAQETWLAVLNGIDRFEGRSTLKTWLFRILTNRAKTRGERESRSVPFSSIGDPDEPAVDPDSFRPDGDQYPGGWKEFPTPWEGDPEERRAFEEHLGICPGCVNYVEQMRKTVATVGVLREDSIPPEARESLLSAFRDWKRQ